jgi:predicted outer membrane protein
MSKILYAASVASHLRAFHERYISALKAEGHEVKTLASGEGVDYNVPFEKKMLSSANKKCRKEIRKILDTEHFDTVILNTSLAAFHIRLAARKRNRPRIVNIVHGYLFPEFAEGLKQKIKRLMLLFAEKLLSTTCD